MTITTTPAQTSGLTQNLPAPAFVEMRPGLSLRTVSLFVNQPSPGDPGYLRCVQQSLLSKGRRLINAAAEAVPAGMRLETLRLIPPQLNLLLRLASSRPEAASMANDEFDVREQAAAELNNHAMRVFGTQSDIQVVLGGFGVSANRIPDWAFLGFLDSLVNNLQKSCWQFALASLGGVNDGINERAVDQTAGAIADLAFGGTRFGAIFGSAERTPFCPCAQHDGDEEGISLGMSGPSYLQSVLRLGSPEESKASLVRTAQRNALLEASGVGGRIASRLEVRFFGCDPSQAPNFNTQSPGSNSIGAVIEQFSGVPLGAPGTKDGFFRLMRALESGGQDSGVSLCGFKYGSFLPVSEDDVIASAVASGHLTYSGILSLCHVCAAGLDMAVVEPGTPTPMIARVLRDVGVTHLLKGKALAVRLIVPERGTPTDTNGYYVFGGLLGRAPVLPLEPFC